MRKGALRKVVLTAAGARQSLPPPGSTLGDRVDRALAEWGAAQPDLDYSPFDVVSRLRRVALHLDRRVDALLEAFGLTRTVVKVLATLRRQGPPYRLSQRALMDHLRLTSATISVRVDQLADLGLVCRVADAADKRSSLVELTEAGLAAYDACAPAYVAELNRLLSALGPDERDLLAALLRRLELSFEGEVSPHPSEATRLGISLSPAHVTLDLQRSFGLPESPGLLVRGVVAGGLADAAGVRKGDVLLRAGGAQLRSVLTLVTAIADAETTGSLWLDILRGSEERALRVDLTSPPATYR